MFLLSVLFMTAWIVAVLIGFAGGFAHLLGLASIVMVVMKGDRRHLRTKDSHQPATV
jgi:hypothetical protein